MEKNFTSLSCVKTARYGKVYTVQQHLYKVKMAKVICDNRNQKSSYFREFKQYIEIFGGGFW